MLQRILSTAVVVVCASIAAISLPVARNIEPPSAAVIQAAYLAESAAGRIAHDPSLEITSADCTAGDGSYLCWVKYRSSASAALQFDVVDLKRERAGWRLTSGLCLPPDNAAPGRRPVN